MGIHRPYQTGGGGITPPRYVACAKCRMIYDVSTMTRETSDHTVNAYCKGRLVCDSCFDGPDIPPPVMPDPDPIQFED